MTSKMAAGKNQGASVFTVTQLVIQFLIVQCVVFKDTSAYVISTESGTVTEETNTDLTEFVTEIDTTLTTTTTPPTTTTTATTAASPTTATTTPATITTPTTPTITTTLSPEPTSAEEDCTTGSPAWAFVLTAILSLLIGFAMAVGLFFLCRGRLEQLSCCKTSDNGDTQMTEMGTCEAEDEDERYTSPPESCHPNLYATNNLGAACNTGMMYEPLTTNTTTSNPGDTDWPSMEAPPPPPPQPNTSNQRVSDHPYANLPIRGTDPIYQNHGIHAEMRNMHDTQASDQLYQNAPARH